MYMNTVDGKRGSHDSIGSAVSSDKWYLAEGATYPGFDEWVLVMNPNDQPVVSSVTFSTPSNAHFYGRAHRAPAAPVSRSSRTKRR